MRRRGPLVCALVAATARAADWPEKYLGVKGDQYNDECRICEQGQQKISTISYVDKDPGKETTHVDEDGEPVALGRNAKEVLMEDPVKLDASDGSWLLIDDEVLEVTSIDGNVLTVVRGFDGTQKAYHVAGSTIYLLKTLTTMGTVTSWNSTKRLFPSDGGKLEYTNFPFRWSGAVGVWKMDEATIEREYPDPDQWRERKEAKECSEELCCAEKKGDCFELNINAVVSVCLAFVLFCACLIWCCCRFVPGCPKYNRRAERRADKMDEEA
mmetsp:Transcript_3723/g.9160  ORF Transcript_3723/g.9160 Transcript_3723/m.9160 type:complete len:269 (-) Transcript_3723:22-828(-)